MAEAISVLEVHWRVRVMHRRTRPTSIPEAKAIAAAAKASSSSG
jgi:hypothetical protein